jgi:hypothetical protein
MQCFVDHCSKHYTEGQKIQWPTEKGQTMIYKTLHRRTENTMVKRKRTKRQTIQWPKEKGQTIIYKTLHRRTDNTMVKRKRTAIVLSVLLCNVL